MLNLVLNFQPQQRDLRQHIHVQQIILKCCPSSYYHKFIAKCMNVMKRNQLGNEQWSGQSPDPRGRKSRPTMLSSTEDFPELYNKT
jgi:hypothetical protein